MAESIDKLRKIKDFPDYLPIAFYTDIFETLLHAASLARKPSNRKQKGSPRSQQKIENLHSTSVHLFSALIQKSDKILNAFNPSKENMQILDLTKMVTEGNLLDQEVAFEAGKYLLRFDKRLTMMDIFTHPTALEKLVRSESLDVWAKLRDIDKVIATNEKLSHKVNQMQSEMRMRKAVQDQQSRSDLLNI